MEAKHLALQGLWLPLVTPSRDGVLDEASLRRLVRHYAREPIEGLILGATTGEGLILDEHEAGRLVALSAAELAGAGKHTPLSLGCPAATRAGPQRRWSTPRNGRSTVISRLSLSYATLPGRTVCAAVSCPVNVLAGGSGTPSVTALAEAGVKRISLGSGLSRAALGGLVRAVREIKEQGTFGFAADALPYADVNGFMLSMGLENNQ